MIRPTLNLQLNTPNLPVHTQTRADQRIVQQSKNNDNITNINIAIPNHNQSTSRTISSPVAQINPSTLKNENDNNNSSNGDTIETIKPEEAAAILDVIRELDARARKKRIQCPEITYLTDEEKAIIHEKLDLLKPMFNVVDKVLPYFYYYTKSQPGTQRLLIMKYMIDDQLKALPGKYLLSLKAVDCFLVQFSKYFVFVEARRKSTSNFVTTNVQNQIIPLMTKIAIPSTLLTPKHSSDLTININMMKRNLENQNEQQEGSPLSSHGNYNSSKKRILESRVSVKDGINNNSSGGNNVNTDINVDFECDETTNLPKDYVKEAKFDESLKKHEIGS
nr:3852_t:CDS:2 [Entrophospora candida]